jgi:hypothetical protein
MVYASTNSREFITSRHSLRLWRLRESTNQWLFVAKKKQGLELGGLYFRRVPLKVQFYGVKGVLGVDRR